jgi:hypothetical protein
MQEAAGATRAAFFVCLPLVLWVNRDTGETSGYPLARRQPGC